MTARRRRFQDKSHLDFTNDGRVISYREMYFKLPPRERPRVNEKAIFAVVQLSNEENGAPLGTRAFLQDRLRRLIKDTKHDGFTKAAQRFRVAIKGFREERPGFYLRSDDLMVKIIAPPSAKFVHPRWYLKQLTAKALPAPAQCYVPEEGEIDLLYIPPSLDRKAEVPLDDPIRLCRKPCAIAAE